MDHALDAGRAEETTTRARLGMVHFSRWANRRDSRLLSQPALALSLYQFSAGGFSVQEAGILYAYRGVNLYPFCLSATSASNSCSARRSLGRPAARLARINPSSVSMRQGSPYTSISSATA